MGQPPLENPASHHDEIRGDEDVVQTSTFGQEPLPQRLEHEQRQTHDHKVHDRGQHEYQVPAAGR
jgi:hypothetical protein